ncbi:hypothetical protein Dsin_022101 [Dipteronia sinensis]|uniref:Cytochrome P450 n=1 Tax=Dipteronia sinensis TaxID=43782 RepID=A0AAE0DZL8_9ROSI|nr:hypothetical protein Dsin_022101 [Dipteronia sinensis]
MKKLIARILENIINEHKQAGGKISEENNKDLVDVLLKFQEDGDDGFHLTTDNIKAVTLDIFVAGANTPSTTVNWAMVELMKNPILMKKTQAEVREFGRANIELALAMLLYHFDWKLPDGMKHEDLDMTEKFGISIRRKDDLNIIPILYHPGV